MYEFYGWIFYFKIFSVNFLLSCGFIFYLPTKVFVAAPPAHILHWEEKTIIFLLLALNLCRVTEDIEDMMRDEDNFLSTDIATRLHSLLMLCVNFIYNVAGSTVYSRLKMTDI